ncbi:MAG TPA: pyridoxamine 5'-phosphate oxidase [Candidatus Binatia bacterium]|jgi:pyridoxamine 5'-phosphate oxidase
MTDPIARFRAWFRAASKAGAPIAEAMVLATADRRGRPSSRYVLLKEASERGFVFYTNAASRKGREMAGNPYVSLVFYWHVTGRQVRIDGKVRVLSACEADEYWQERPVGSRYASAASDQSRPIASRRELLRRYSKLQQQYPDGEIPRPAHWKGYLVVPDTIEFWTRAEPRLHRRERFTRVRTAGSASPTTGSKTRTAGSSSRTAWSKSRSARSRWESEILQP